MDYNQNGNSSWNSIIVHSTTPSSCDEPVESHPWNPVSLIDDSEELFNDACPSLSDFDSTPSILPNDAPGAVLGCPSPPRTSVASHGHPSEERDVAVSFSTTFYPGNPGILLAPDIVLSSDDGTLFYLNSHLLASTGFNVDLLLPLETFAPFDDCASSHQGPPLMQGAVSKLPDSSITLSIIFHVLYGLSSAPQELSFDDLSEAISRMACYNLSPSALVQPGTPLYQELMATYAPFHPLSLYTLAAHHDMEQLAVATSSHLLGYDLSRVTDGEATSMGALYLKRLFCMPKDRKEQLKRLLVHPPLLHDSKEEGCDIASRSRIRRKWAFLVTRLAWDARPDISPYAIQERLRPAGEALSCTLCRESWKQRYATVATDWATVKSTI